MRYLVAILAVIFLIILGTVLLVGGGDSNGTTKNPARITKLADYGSKDSASVTWTQQGRVIGDDQYKAIRVTVSRTSRRAEILSGYQEHVERSVDFPNTAAAFETFTHALDLANFGKERNVKVADDRGVCPLGNRFIYRLTDSGKEVMRTWSDNCSNADGPFGGGNSGANTIQQLFRGQITNYDNFVSNVIL